jgi:SAM-dependent methyltransferase
MNSTTGASRSCLLCGAELRPYLKQVNDHISGENFSVLKCVGCGLGITENAPEHLSPYYRDYYCGRHGFTAKFRAWQRLSLVRKKMKMKVEQSLLDVGCGEGTFLLAARKDGWTVAGTEMNPALAREQGLEVVEDLAAFGGKREFDCVTMWHSLEHMRDPMAVVRAVHPLLKREGWLFVAVPDAGGWQARFSGEDWLHLDVPRHLYHFGRESLRLLHEKCGFQVREEHHQEFEYDVLGWSQSALNKIFPTRNLFFRQLTGKAHGTPGWERAANWVAGPAVSAVALPTMWCNTVFRHGGTLIFASKKAAVPSQKR